MEGYIHRDIAARNCLVQTVSTTNPKPKLVKLSDFGLARDVGYSGYHSSAKEATLPVAWTAPESFRGHFSHKSDVWAFRVLIWEVFSWSSTPFQCCSVLPSHQCPLVPMPLRVVTKFVCEDKKNLLDWGTPCNAMFTLSLIDLMQWCWAYDPEERLFFSQLLKFLQKASRDCASNQRSWTSKSSEDTDAGKQCNRKNSAADINYAKIQSDTPRRPSDQITAAYTDSPTDSPTDAPNKIILYASIGSHNSSSTIAHQDSLTSDGAVAVKLYETQVVPAYSKMVPRALSHDPKYDEKTATDDAISETDQLLRRTL